MLRIRQEQVSAFVEAALKSFEDRMINHLNTFFREPCEALGERKTRQAIQHGIQRAATHGLLTERNVCKYIDLIFVFGRDFDITLPWARQILNDQSLRDPTMKINLLCDAAIQNDFQATHLKNTGDG